MTYGLPISCHRCGGPLTHVAASPPMSNGLMSRAVAMCDPCRLEHRVTVVLQLTQFSHVTENVAVCGTISGYQRHRRAREKACAACLEANAEARRVARKRMSAC